MIIDASVLYDPKRRDTKRTLRRNGRFEIRNGDHLGARRQVTLRNVTTSKISVFLMPDDDCRDYSSAIDLSIVLRNGATYCTATYCMGFTTLVQEMARLTISRMPLMNVPRQTLEDEMARRRRQQIEQNTGPTNHRTWAPTPEHFDFYAYQQMPIATMA